MYGEKNTFEDARTTVTEFLDDFYDDAGDNYNQAFLNLERRLQEYFGYEPRGPADGEEESLDIPDRRPRRKCEFVVYRDGVQWASFADKADAEAAVRAYRAEHDMRVERVPEDAP